MDKLKNSNQQLNLSPLKMDNKNNNNQILIKKNE